VRYRRSRKIDKTRTFDRQLLFLIYRLVEDGSELADHRDLAHQAKVVELALNRQVEEEP